VAVGSNGSSRHFRFWLRGCPGHGWLHATRCLTPERISSHKSLVPRGAHPPGGFLPTRGLLPPSGLITQVSPSRECHGTPAASVILTLSATMSRICSDGPRFGPPCEPQALPLSGRCQLPWPAPRRAGKGKRTHAPQEPAPRTA